MLARGLVLLAGLALPFSFAPTEWWLIAPLSIGLFYYLLQEQTPRECLIRGALFGLAYFGIGVHWVYHSLHLFGAAIAPLAVLLTMVFVMVMAVFPSLTAWFWARWRQPSSQSSSSSLIRNALLFTALWVVAELLRGKIMGGFPWILVGYSQTDGPLGSFAPWIGVYGLSACVVLFAALLVCVVLTRGVKQYLVAGAMIIVVLVAALANRIEVSTPVGDPLAVRLVQANIPQELKFSQERLNNSLRQYAALTQQNLGSHFDNGGLVIWPETAIPTFFDVVDDYFEPFTTALSARGIEVLSGGFYREGDKTYNSVRQLGGEKALYQKRHLVPFGEFMPMRFLLDFAAAFIQIPMSDLSPGTGPYMPLSLRGVEVGVSICYEDVYGEEMRALLPTSTLLVNVSNDAWFGPTAAPHQHEQKARMRAREFARPLVRVTNTGVSSSINHLGQVEGRIAHDTQGILDVTVQPREGMTLYAKTGNWPVFLWALAVLLVAILQRRFTFTR